MKVLILIQCTNLGGMEKCAYLLGKELLSLGVEVEFLSLNPPGPLAPLLREAGIPVRSAGYRGLAGWRSFLATRRMLRSIRADAMIMIGHNLMAMFTAGKRWHGRRILCMHFHHQGVKASWAWHLIYRLALPRFRAIVFPCRFIFEEACQIAPFIRAKARVVANPFPVPECRTEREIQAARRRLGLDRWHKVVGNAGWLIEEEAVGRVPGRRRGGCAARAPCAVPDRGRRPCARNAPAARTAWASPIASAGWVGGKTLPTSTWRWT